MPLSRAACLRLAACLALLGVSVLGAGCSPIGLAMTAAGIATDTSITWDVVKHVHGKLTEDDPTPCLRLSGVQRALNPRCDYRPGAITTADLARTGLQECVLTTAVRDPRLWRALPELIERGATVERCAGSPLSALAAANPCPDFAAAGKAERAALVGLALDDARAVRHDVFRMFSCPSAHAAGLDEVLGRWLARGDLAIDRLSFSPLGALHPDMLGGILSQALQKAGHRPQTALDGYDGVLASGFEESLRTSNWAALEWWFARVPRLVNQAPPSRGGQLAWLPLQRVLVAGFLQHPQSQAGMVTFLLSHGADPKQRLPFDRDATIVSWARQAKSPMLSLLDPPPAPVDLERVPLHQASAAQTGSAAAR